ncbi:MAG: alpha-amylase [Gammaproteobacteria bacterium]|nr:alpha-amylase [Gammaproteobacteria bacterium]
MRTNAELYQSIHQRLAYLYGEEQAPAIARHIRRLIDTHTQLRDIAIVENDWSQADVLLITYGDSVQAPAQPPLHSLKQFIDVHLRDAFNLVHILPFYPWSSDGGFSVTDFRAVHSELGTWQDIAALGEHFKLVFDLVLNHCSRENLWFADYIFGEEPACHYFIEVDPKENLSMVTRPRSTPVLTKVRTHRGMKHVWATFSNDQIDLNYANPTVLLEFIDIILYYIRRGARMLRLDAVAYLWKQIGTNCIHLPQTHEVIKLIRDVLAVVEPGVWVLTETNVPHQENISYFGQGDEAHLVYQFSLPPLLLQALHSGNTGYLRNWALSLEQTPLPEHCTYLNFTASHDGVGLRPLEGLLPKEEIDAFLAAMRERGGYISTKSNIDGSESPYELNISYFDAFRAPGGSDNQWHIAAFLLSQIVALSLKGIPAVYIHSLLATPNDNLGVERSGLTRAINRRQLDRSEIDALLANHESEPGRVFSAYRRILKVRRRQAAFHPEGRQIVLALPDGLFGIERQAPDGRQKITALFNFTSQPQSLPLQGDLKGIDLAEDVLGESDVRIEGGYLLLPPYAGYWFAVE